MGYQNLDLIRKARKHWGEKYGYDMADAILGNVQVETANTFDPRTVQRGKGYTNDEYLDAVYSGKVSFVNGTIGFGWYQTTSRGRQQFSWDFHASHGYRLGDFQATLELFDAEIQRTGYANVRRAIKEHWGLDECTRIICTEYERPRSMQQGETIKEQAIQKRIANAHAIRAFFEAEEKAKQKEEQKVEVTPPMAKNGMTICLDAGHYGKYNHSPEVPAYYESDFTWKFTNFEKAEYERLGFTVILTRSDKDKDLALDKRGKMSKGCDLFKSNHSNACGTESVDHPSIIIPTKYKGTDFDGCKVLGNRIGENIHKVMDTKQVAKVYYKDAGYDRNKNGVSGDDEYYGVMNGAQSVKCPRYMIVEHGFHTNKANAEWLLNDANVKALAISEAQVVAQYLLGLQPSDTHVDNNQPIGTVVYITKAGDNLTKIAKAYGVTVDEIVALNGITNRNLIGKNVKLLIPATTSKITYYTVKHGDSLSAIARDFTKAGHKVTYVEIAKANDIPFPYNLIHEGDTLIIP